MGHVAEEDWVFLSEKDVLASSNIVQVYRDYWWCVHPEKGLRFFQSNKRRRGRLQGASPQCNRSQGIAESFCYAGDQIKQIPLVLAPIDLSDYRD